MFGIGFSEIVIICLVALMVLGPKKLPQVAKELGRFFVHLRRMSMDVKQTVDQVIEDAENEIRAEKREALKQIVDVKNSFQETLPHDFDIEAKKT